VVLEGADVVQDPVAFHDVEAAQGDGRAQRVSAEGVAVVEDRAGAVEDLGDLGADEGGAHGGVAGGDALGDGDDVGAGAVAVAAEPLAEAAERGDHLVGDEQEAVAVGECPEAGPVALGRGDAAAAVLHRFGDQHGDRLRALGEDRGLQLAQQVGGEGGVVRQLPCQTEAVGVGHEPGLDRGRAVGLLQAGVVGERQGADGQAVVGAAAGDRLGAARVAAQGVVLAGDLPGGLDGFGAAAGEEGVLDVDGRDPGQAFGEFDGGRVCGGGPQRAEAEFAELPVGGLGELGRVGVAELAAVQAGEAVDVASAVRVVDVGPSPRCTTKRLSPSVPTEPLGVMFSSRCRDAEADSSPDEVRVVLVVIRSRFRRVGPRRSPSAADRPACRSRRAGAPRRPVRGPRRRPR
jgi:hypothetical protein